MAPPVELAIEPPLEVAVPASASAPSASCESEGLLKTMDESGSDGCPRMASWLSGSP